MPKHHADEVLLLGSGLDRHEAADVVGGTEGLLACRTPSRVYQAFHNSTQPWYLVSRRSGPGVRERKKERAREKERERERDKEEEEEIDWQGDREREVGTERERGMWLDTLTRHDAFPKARKQTGPSMTSAAKHERRCTASGRAWKYQDSPCGSGWVS